MNLNYRFSHILQGTMDFCFSTYRYWIVINGRGQISYEDGTIFLSTHDVLEIPVNCHFTLECISQIQLGIIEVTDLKQGNKRLQKKPSIETELIRKTFFFAIDYCSYEQHTANLLKYHVDTLMYETLMKTGLNEYRINPKIAWFLDNIDQHLYESDYDINPLIKETGYSKSHFHKLFHDTTGVSPIEYIHEHRIDRAKKMLLESHDYTIKEIATACGYNDVYYFSRLFRKSTGIPPSQYPNR